MKKIILMSCECPGLPLGVRTCEGDEIHLLLLPSGSSLTERIAKISVEQRLATLGLVSLLTDSLPRDSLVAIKSRLPHLRLIANYAVGYNNIDVAAAKELSIAVTNTPQVLGDATADLTMTLILMVTRRIFAGALELHEQGRFAGWSPHYGLGMGLKGKTLGIVGMGDIGKRVAERAVAFGLHVVALESLRASAVRDERIPRLGEDEFLRSIDILSLHCPLTPQTRGWLNAQRLSRMKRGAVVINTARGEVVDEPALAAALRSGHLFGAGLDVFCGEPQVSEFLRGVPHLLVLPHLGSATSETRAAMGERVMENIRALILGLSPLPTQVNR